MLVLTSLNKMRSIVAIILTSFVLTEAQNISNLPPCSFTCMLNAVQTTICSSTDYSCICRAIPSFENSALACLSAACDAQDLAASTKVLQSICLNAGVVVSLPTTSVSATGTESANPSRTGSVVLANPTTTMATLTTPSSSQTSQATVTVPVPVQTSTASQSQGLSSTAKVGLGVGIPLGLALFAVIGWLLYRSYKRKLELARGSGTLSAISGPTRRLSGSSANSVDRHRMQDATVYSAYLSTVDKERSPNAPRIDTIELPTTRN